MTLVTRTIADDSAAFSPPLIPGEPNNSPPAAAAVLLGP